MTRLLDADFEKRFGPETMIQAALRRPVDRFSITVLFGPSGCGKTTVLRCLAGLERPERGTIRFADEVWHDAAAGLSLAPQRRGIGFLFQDYALFPHLTVAQNIAYGLARLVRDERQRRVAELLRLFQLSGLEDRYPRQISGGQQQRVALARTVAPRPRLLLLDEPLSALDGPTRVELRGELRRLLAETAIPAIVVTHDVAEVTEFADELVVMCAGRVRQSGSVSDVFAHPADDEVARILSREATSKV